MSFRPNYKTQQKPVSNINIQHEFAYAPTKAFVRDVKTGKCRMKWIWWKHYVVVYRYEGHEVISPIGIIDNDADWFVKCTLLIKPSEKNLLLCPLY